jgi:phosphate transport system substrate-binding protein
MDVGSNVIDLWDESFRMERCKTTRSKSLRRFVLALAAGGCVLAGFALPSAADTLILQGSTTFNRRIIEPYKAAIEAQSGQDLTIIPNRSMLGVVALMEGRAHMAMISASIESEVKRLKTVMPGLDYDRLRVFEIASTRVAFVVNPTNPVRKISLEQMTKVLRGEIADWNALQGKSAPIRLVAVGAGGGIITTVETELLQGQRVSNPNITYVRTALQLISVVEQESDALGFAQLALARQKGLPELVTESPVEQSLSFVTLGEPTPQMKAVIDAARKIAEKSM